jgi:hypothetical protein
MIEFLNETNPFLNKWADNEPLPIIKVPASYDEKQERSERHYILGLEIACLVGWMLAITFFALHFS